MPSPRNYRRPQYREILSRWNIWLRRKLWFPYLRKFILLDGQTVTRAAVVCCICIFYSRVGATPVDAPCILPLFAGLTVPIFMSAAMPFRLSLILIIHRVTCICSAINLFGNFPSQSYCFMRPIFGSLWNLSLSSSLSLNRANQHCSNSLYAWNSRGTEERRTTMLHSSTHCPTGELGREEVRCCSYCCPVTTTGWTPF